MKSPFMTPSVMRPPEMRLSDSGPSLVKPSLYETTLYETIPLRTSLMRTSLIMRPPPMCSPCPTCDVINMYIPTPPLLSRLARLHVSHTSLPLPMMQRKGWRSSSRSTHVSPSTPASRSRSSVWATSTRT